MLNELFVILVSKICVDKLVSGFEFQNKGLTPESVSQEHILNYRHTGILKEQKYTFVANF